MINIDIIYDIDCLQVFQHASGSKKYLRVPTNTTSWSIGPNIDENASFISSGSAGGVSPADPHNPINRRFNQTSWRYWDMEWDNGEWHNGEWHNGEIVVKCITHS